MAQVLDRKPTQPSQPEVPGVRVLDEGSARLQKRLVLVVTILPFIGLVAAVWSAWGSGLGSLELTLFLTMYFVAGFGVTIGFHRLFTHRSFQTKRWVRSVLAIAGSMAVQGPVIRWVADHRRHHAFSDQPGDPHSPHLDEGPGVRGVLKGLWHAHMGWLFSEEQTSARRWAPDLVKDPAMRTIDRLFPLWVVISFTLPAFVGLVVTGTFAGAASAFLWGSLVRIFLLHHVTWSINSVCHFFGSRRFASEDHSTNVFWLALLSFGESWHHNHHAFPRSAVHGLRWWELDPTAWIVRAMKRTRLAWNVVEITGERQRQKLA